MAASGKPAKSQTGALIHAIEVRTSRRTELLNVTREVERLVAETGCTNGSCELYVPHTTAGVIINEGDDPAVARDIGTTLDRLVPRAGDYRHAEGNSDSHIKTALVGVSKTVWIENGRLALGRWQAISWMRAVLVRLPQQHLCRRTP